MPSSTPVSPYKYNNSLRVTSREFPRRDGPYTSGPGWHTHTTVPTQRRCRAVSTSAMTAVRRTPGHQAPTTDAVL